MRSNLTKKLQSVVKVLTVSDSPDYEQPWQSHGPSNSTGSGGIVLTKRGLRVLTNGHVVQNQVFVELRRFGASRKYVAEVEGVSHECDLALLRVPREEFFQGAEPIEIGTLPLLGDTVTVCGYPIGGDRLSLTQGVVSRIEVSAYSHSQRPLLSVQIDAAVNAGNSGGPVFKGDKLIGVAFQALDESQNIAYAISVPVIEHFLADLDAGRPATFPSLGVVWQRLESDSHRRSLGLKRADGGVLVARVAYESTAWGVIQEGDVILAIDGEPVGSDGTVQLRTGELVDHSHRVALRAVGDTLRLALFRERRRIEVDVVLQRPSLLVPEDQYDIKPTYYVFGGFLFAPLTRDYLKSWGNEWWKAAPNELVSIYENQIRTPERREVVILQKVLADRVNQGYHEHENHVVVAIDGVPVKSIVDLVDLIDNGAGTFVSVHLADGQRLVLERAKARERGVAILDRYNLRFDRSPDLRKKQRPARAVSKPRAKR
ncbi:MAG: trypsin-like peptidase domain-containing protein [Polyangiaceae bacterium]|jgi:S1-C subfamily serine protease|nr:trypsin-like peptidase domain-containing protein [Polyangiaceae bacterium]MBK8941951.1 trypsin-like peptidase domain-containing protein [Polyangiaceae bacterium]